MDLREIYEAGVTKREPFLNMADAVAKVTLPELNPRGDYGAAVYTNSTSPSSLQANMGQPYSSAGTSAVTSLSSTILSLLFPMHVPWIELEATDEALKEAKENTAEVDANLAIMERRMLDRMLLHQYHAEMLQTLIRVLVEGTTLVHKLPSHQGLRHIPLRSFIVKRFNGKLAYACMREEMPNPEKPHETKHLFTFVDYSKGEIWQQESDQKDAQKVNEKPSHYIVVTTTIPSDCDYAPGFAWRYFGTMNTINQLSKDMIRAAAIAAKAIMIIDPDSGFTPHEIRDLVSGQAISGDAEAIKWLSAALKLDEWSWVWQAIQALNMDLAKNFALGLSQQPDLQKDRQTAEAIRRLSQELDANAGAIAQVLQTTLQKPLAQAYLEDELAASKGEDLLAKLRPVVTSGTSAISRLSELQRLMDWVSIFIQMDPNFLAGFDTNDLFTHGAKIIGVPVSDFLKPRTAPQLPPGPQMAA